MTLKDIYEQNQDTMLVGIYKKGEKIYPDFIDEVIETHGDKEVNDYTFHNNILIVEFKED